MALWQDINAAPVAVTSPFTERILIVFLYLAMLLSSVAFVEPSPHDGMMMLVAFAFLLASVRFERLAALPLLLLLIWNVAGLVALMNSIDNDKAVQYSITSFYLSIVTILFASIFARGDARRLAAMRAGYIASAVLASLAGIAGYFHLFPGSDMFLLYERATGPFKDPNVYGPYLIWPALFVIARSVSQRMSARDIVIAAILSAGIFLSFSRGAWMHFLVSTLVMMALLVITAPTPRDRMRIVMLNVFAIIGAGLVLMALMSLDSVREMFLNRAQAVQSYDVGQGGRFILQEIALGALLDFPFGMGPLEFARVYGLQQHNVYLQAFIVYGWIGGFSYLLLLAATLIVGIRTLMVATPWQPYLITAYAAFVGEIGEGSIIDTDHWRHFFLLLGMIWGLAAATIRFRHEQAASSFLNRRPAFD